MKRVRTASVALLGLAAVTVGTIAVAPPAGAAKKPTTITVLVTNDDGVSAPGIDALVQALRTSKNTKVVVVAPATNQSGSGGKTTPGTLTTQPATTASGYQATAVQGYPADTVTAALDQLGVKPNVVMSGINPGQNVGVAHGPLGHHRRGQDGRHPRDPGSGVQPGRRRAAIRRHREARTGVAGAAPRRARRRSRRPRPPRSTTTTSRSALRASPVAC